MIKQLIENKHENHMIPFFWQHGADEQTLREVIKAIYLSGCRALCAESRPHPDFAGEKWWQDMDVIMDECKKLGMQVWILDDAHFPTGYANGAAAGSPHRRLFLSESHVDIIGPQKGTSLLIEPEGRPGNRTSDQEGIVAVVAGKRIPGKDIDHNSFTNIDGVPVEELTDLTHLLEDGIIHWDIPEGLWRIFTFTATHVRTGAGANPRPYVNPLTEEGGRILIDAVYEPHFKRYGKDFGKTFRGFFSDEPTFANHRGYHSIIGHAPFMQLPWRVDMLSFLSESMGEDARRLLPALWYESENMAPQMRFAYMDVASRLYGENFCSQLGRWCEEHGAEYMGHVIEENNCHARLGNGTGHFFRALWGQHFSGIDVVLHEIVPGIKGGSHAWTSSDFEADDDFFYYMLAQMATSLAHIDPKKKGRAMCEIFGAYGWQEGNKQMKWLADFMLARGINYYIPHAFTEKAFPDPDCPPHFYAFGHNPQFKGFGKLITYMNRICTLIDGGIHRARAAVLYYAEAEWASGYDCMKTQLAVKELNQRQIECDVLPMDILADAKLEGGEIKINGEEYELLIVPYAKYLPYEFAETCARLTNAGVPVIFIDGLPEASSAGGGDICAALEKADVKVLPLSDIAGEACRILKDRVETDSFQPDVKLYHYAKSGEEYLLLHNEDIFNSKAFKLKVPAEKSLAPFLYDAIENSCHAAAYSFDGGAYEIEVEIAPYEMKLLVLSGFKPEFALCPIVERCADISDKFKTISLCEARDYPDFTHTDLVPVLGNLNAPGRLPRFSGFIRYEAQFEGKAGAPAVLDVGEAHETVQVFINGEDAGMKIVPPYRFDIGALVKDGPNHLAVEIANTLVHKQRDGLSRFQAMPPSGLIGPVRILT
ncbi:MAG: glycosyl transferase family 2 [Christensenellales bacterium]